MEGDRLRAYRETRQQLIDGWCESRLANLNSLHDQVERMQDRLPREDLAAYRRALAQERAYPCPPGGPPTPPPPAQAASVGIAPKAPAPSPAQPAPAPAPVTGSPKPAQGLTQDDIDEVARQQRALAIAERERREEEERRNSGIRISAGYGEAGTPGANYGVVRDGPVGNTTEQPAAISNQRVPTLILEAALSGQFGKLVFRYREGDARNSVSIPASTSGGARGTAYTDNAPSGSTGAIGSTVALNAGSETRVQGGSFYYDMGPLLSSGSFLGGGDLEESLARTNKARFLQGTFADFSIGLGFYGSYEEVDREGDVQLTQFDISILNQNYAQRVTELTLGFQASLGLSIHSEDGLRFTTQVSGGAHYYDMGLDSRETVSQTFGPANDRAFSTALTDDKSGIGFRGDASAELGVDLSQSVELFLGGGVTWYSDRAQVVNPFSGTFVQNGGTTFLDSRDATDWRAMLGLRVRLGSAN